MSRSTLILALLIISCHSSAPESSVRVDEQCFDKDGKVVVRVFDVGERDHMLKKYEVLYWRHLGRLDPVDLGNLKRGSPGTVYVAWHYLDGLGIEFYPDDIFLSEFPTALGVKQSFVLPELVTAGPP